ncbi:hypothetical protein GCM10026987_04970 [Belliella aquatica]|uniref:F-box domain-containing protein n=1 Tax=Belliella aquatica TaxID=1323734 RepID=A0ABQ1MBQ0_9BACT|nr:hypothetical protein GCM10010993_15910 [Belliella aquatica]
MIDKLVFELGIDQRSDFDILVSQIPDAVVDQLSEFIDQQLAVFKISEQDLLINKLEIDLGTLSLDDFSTNLLDKFKKAFIIALQKFLKSNSGLQFSKEELPFILIQYFLYQAVMPWWVNTKSVNSNVFFQQALQKNPKRLLKVLKQLQRQPLLRKRFIENIKEDFLLEVFFATRGTNQLPVKSEMRSIQFFLKRRFKHLSTHQIGILFKKILLDFIFYPYELKDSKSLFFVLSRSIDNNVLGNEYLSNHKSWFPSNSGILFQKENLLENNSARHRSTYKQENLRGSLLLKFYFYLENGYSIPERRASAYKFQNFNTLFAYLLKDNLENIVDFLRTHGKNHSIKKRFLESVSQELLGKLFLLVAPEKRKLLQWVLAVFEKVQEEYKPINQTFIQVRKSINEITFELFLNKKINAISDSNYLRFLFKQTAKKYGIQYNRLLFYTLKAIDTGGNKYKLNNFHQVLMGLYHIDILKDRASSLILSPFSPQIYSGIVGNDFKNKDVVFNLFLELYKMKFKRSDSKVVDWLRINVQGSRLGETSNLIELWEIFAAKFNVQKEGLLIPLLIAQGQNSSLDLTESSYNKLKRQYKLKGAYRNRKSKINELVSSLQAQKHLIPKKILLEIFQHLPVDFKGDKLTFLKSVNLINPKLTSFMEEYIQWLGQTTQSHGLVHQQNKVFNWLFYQILLAPQRKYTLASLQEWTLEFLKIADLSIKSTSNRIIQVDGKANQWRNAGELKPFRTTKMADPLSYKQPNLVIARFFHLIGKNEIYSFFPDAYKFNEQSLFQLLLSKYAIEFLLTLKKNQFNVELRDYILIQAPKWLKRDLLYFLDAHHQKLQFQLLEEILKKLATLQWITLKGEALRLFLEKILWTSILGTKELDYQDLWVLVLDKAATDRLFSDQFWKDTDLFENFSDHKKGDVMPQSSKELKILNQQGYLSYFAAFNPNVKEIEHAIPVFESLINKSVFPSAHIFEGNEIKDYIRYINRLVIENKLALVSVLKKTDSNPLLHHFLQFLNTQALKIVLVEAYQQVNVFLPIKQIHSILKYFKVSDPQKQHLVFAELIVRITDKKNAYLSPIETISSILVFLLDQRIISREQFTLRMNWLDFFEGIGFTPSEEVLFLAELKKQHWFKPEFDSMLTSKGRRVGDLFSPVNLDFIYFPNSFGISHYQNFFKKAIAQEFILKSHQPILAAWEAFAVRFKDKVYFQNILQIYFFNKLYLVSQSHAFKAQFVYTFMNKLMKSENQLTTFFSRLANEPSLIAGIPFISLETKRGTLANKWFQIWHLENKNERLLLGNSKDFSEYYIHLLISKGLRFFEEQESLRKITPEIIEEIRSIPLNKLWSYDFHEDFWMDLFSIKSESEIFGYFVKGPDPYLRQIKGQKVLSIWLEQYFNKQSQTGAVAFLNLFQKNFYSNTINFEKKVWSFFNEFLSLPQGKKTYQEILKLKHEELDIFETNAPNLFKSLRTVTFENQKKLELDEILERFLSDGVLPFDQISLKDLGKALSTTKGKSLKRYRLLIFSALQSNFGRKNIIKLLSHLDEDWYFKLIHPKLPVDLDFLNRNIRNRLNKNLFAKLRITQKLDRLIYITDIWKTLNLHIKHPVEILIPVVENWIKEVDPVLVAKVFNPNEAKSELFALLMNASQKIKSILDDLEEETVMLKVEEKLDIEEVDYGEGVTIANAGLILCWPFYGRFFSALGMVQNGEFSGEIMEEKAIQLLQYIATGKVESEEWNLTLNKILCGVKPDFPVSPTLELSIEEEELCEKLIKGTIYNWEKIRGTKLETFRETFLNREGRLFEKDNRWELIVEKKAYDVLLDTLPWNISMINLSWMKKRLTVQWQ